MLPKGKSLYLIIPILALVAAVLFYQFEIYPKVSPVARGELLAIESGCYACHGMSELDLRTNFRTSSSGELRPKSVPTFWENGIDRSSILIEWIRDGSTERERERHKRYLMQMPAYGNGHLDESEIDSIAAWILAKNLSQTQGMGNGELEMPQLTVEAVTNLTEDEIFFLGDRLSRQQACYQCHGELGQGGIFNLASFKGYIPGFWGEDFLELTANGDREEILHWIDHGRGIAIESGLKGVFSKKYFEDQAIPMPGYADLIGESEKAILVEYLLFLNKSGALTSMDLERQTKVLADLYAKSQDN